MSFLGNPAYMQHMQCSILVHGTGRTGAKTNTCDVVIDLQNRSRDVFLCCDRRFKHTCMQGPGADREAAMLVWSGNQLSPCTLRLRRVGGVEWGALSLLVVIGRCLGKPQQALQCCPSACLLHRSRRAWTALVAVRVQRQHLAEHRIAVAADEIDALGGVARKGCPVFAHGV
ncbi:hypothetical protein DL89DRAFT_172463 [Linderina pennispora]|uniref:Uncharacterized protein n=1 Tax=Linderina pennispora TaxID=61395 RepID=A0A1Y1W7N9_9FUNG|nr:uncharacterized protein DL89DRAFT_172463 [Linderina pennispora]ORX69184.1 hypothetical protein DL89DRAFT_172463 [Linderina pennispora]